VNDLEWYLMVRTVQRQEEKGHARSLPDYEMHSVEWQIVMIILALIFGPWFKFLFRILWGSVITIITS